MRLGNTFVFAGRPEEGPDLTEKARRLNPHYPVQDLLLLGVAYCEAGRYEKAIEPGKKFLALNPNSGPGHYHLAVCYAELGRLEEARAEVAEMLRVNPKISLEWVRQNLLFKDPGVLSQSPKRLSHSVLPSERELGDLSSSHE
jgi:adenylate cyclase